MFLFLKSPAQFALFKIIFDITTYPKKKKIFLDDVSRQPPTLTY